MGTSEQRLKVGTKTNLKKGVGAGIWAGSRPSLRLQADLQFGRKPDLRCKREEILTGIGSGPLAFAKVRLFPQFASTVEVLTTGSHIFQWQPRQETRDPAFELLAADTFRSAYYSMKPLAVAVGKEMQAVG